MMDKRSRELLELLDETTTPYAVRLVTEVCGQQYVIPGALLEIGTSDGEAWAAFAPFLDQVRSLGDHTLIHVNRDADHGPYD